MCLEHPFHSLYQVYYLLPSEQETGQNRRQSSSQSTARSDAASEIFDRLRGDPRSQQRLKDVELVAGACLQWAQHKISPEKKAGDIPADQKILKIIGVKVPVLTCHTPLDPSCNYDNCVFIDKFEKVYETAGGINLPKICKCLGADGARYKQLVSVLYQY
jgi:ataxia telangiectasia mutated family protein